MLHSVSEWQHDECRCVDTRMTLTEIPTYRPVHPQLGDPRLVGDDWTASDVAKGRGMATYVGHRLVLGDLDLD